MLGKSTLENYPGLKKLATTPVAVVHTDIYSSSIPSSEGYNHSLILTDSYAEYPWQYGMNTKDETMSMVKRWLAEIAEVRKDHPLLVAIRDNAGENTSKELNEISPNAG